MKGLAESGHNYFRVPFAICVYFLKSAHIKLPPKHLRGVKQKYTGRSEKTHQCLARAKEEVDNISKKPIGMKWGRAGLKGQTHIKWFINPIFSISLPHKSSSISCLQPFPTTHQSQINLGLVMMILMFNGEGAYDGEDNHNDIPDICLFSYTSAI